MNRIAAQRLSSTSRFSEPGLSVEVGLDGDNLS